MNFLEALAAVLVPGIPLVLPGAFFIRTRDWGNLLLTGSRIILWSMGSMTLSLTAFLAFGIPVWVPTLILAALSLVNVVRHHREFFSRASLWHNMAILVPLVLATALFAIPFFMIHDGLPTGDVQKTILWAEESLATHKLPDYGKSITLLNRDPVDFYTPGLHAVSSLILSWSPFPLTSIGLFAIMIALCVAWIAATLTKEMFDNHPHVVPPILAALFILTQYRFLRYLREPGYHIQNVVGELFLFGMILLLVRFVRRRQMQDAVLFLVCASALFFTHQFSLFIAVFVVGAMMVALIAEYRSRIVYHMRTHVRLSLIAMALLLISLAIASSLQLGDKLPAIFTTTPHLSRFLPDASAYVTIMGAPWFFAGLTGVLMMVVFARRKDEHHRQVVLFASGSAAMLLLSQGPFFGIDIPPIRALFYSVVPFSIGAAYLFGRLFLALKRSTHGVTRKMAFFALAFGIISICTNSTYRAYASLSHTVRTNSTLTGEQLTMIEQLRKNQDGGILIDDYNRRSGSWLVLSGHPMFTRIAADLRQQMEEASQSKLRMQLYLRQLDFEKILSLGSLPEISNLLAKNEIRYITGIARTSDTALSHNKSLHPIAVSDDTTLYEVNDTDDACTSPECSFLLRSATLANDIGDEQDTFLHLMASIRSPRLSIPIEKDGRTYRESTAPQIPFLFNVGSYVSTLWDPNGTHHSETSLTFLLHLTKPVSGLTLVTPSGNIHPLPAARNISIQMFPDEAPIDDDGFITLTIQNPRSQRVGIDLVALGPSLVP